MYHEHDACCAAAPRHQLVCQSAHEERLSTQAIQGLAQDMWLRMESEAKLTWSGLSEYRTALEESARSSDDMRVHSHQEVVIICHSTVTRSMHILVSDFEMALWLDGRRSATLAAVQ